MVLAEQYQLKVFLCHSLQDRKVVNDLYLRLKQLPGITIWFENENLLPGQDRELEIRKAVRKSDAVIICLSKAALSTPDFFQATIRIALEVADNQPEGAIFIIPLLLEECDDIPERLIKLTPFRYYLAEEGYARLKKALQARTAALKTAPVKTVSPIQVETLYTSQGLVTIEDEIFQPTLESRFSGSTIIVPQTISLRPFVSANKTEPERACREVIFEAIRGCNGDPLTLELWDSDYREAMQLGLQKIQQECSHFIGVVGYQRSPVIDSLKLSTGEIEFKWALDYKTPNLLMFVPNPVTDFGVALASKASQQSVSDLEAQRIFRERVRATEFCQLFDNEMNLAIKITRKVMQWSNFGLRSIAAQSQTRANSGNLNSNARPSEDKIIELGRVAYVRQFEDILTSDELAELSCFLIHGQSGFGHREMTQRLRWVFEKFRSNSVKPRYCQIPIGVLWRQSGLAKLLELIGAKLEPGWIPVSVEELAGRFSKMLELSDIILDITNLQRFESSLIGFNQYFWQPLTVALKNRQPNHLIVFVSFVADQLSLEWDSFLHTPQEENLVSNERNKIIKMPKLDPFSVRELSSWLRTGGWIPRDQVETLAATLIAETQGGWPDLLYDKLRDEVLWLRQEGQ